MLFFVGVCCLLLMYDVMGLLLLVDVCSVFASGRGVLFVVVLAVLGFCVLVVVCC